MKKFCMSLMFLVVAFMGQMAQAQLDVNDGDIWLGSGPGGTDWVIVDGWVPYGEITSTNKSWISWDAATSIAVQTVADWLTISQATATASGYEWKILLYSVDEAILPSGQYITSVYAYVVVRDPLPPNPLRDPPGEEGDPPGGG